MEETIIDVTVRMRYSSYSNFAVNIEKLVNQGYVIQEVNEVTPDDC